MAANWKLCLGATVVAMLTMLPTMKGQQQPVCVDYSKDPAGCQPSTFDTPIGQLPTVRVNRTGAVCPAAIAIRENARSDFSGIATCAFSART